mmetsp:Transcript_44356/g.51967  ORF Transcript_44356/g.51967 Transcript_44356/m.51967 type:complete len:308 (-) Transcript_44356:172-1095(-)
MEHNSAEQDGTKTARQFIFGFGSLISPESRARTGDTGAYIAHVATISDCERSWSLRVNLPPAAVVNPDINGVSAVAVRLLPSDVASSTSGEESLQRASCAGVVMEVPKTELPNFDAREIGYRREQIQWNRVALHSGQSCQEVLGAGAVVWCFVDENISATPLASFPQLPTPEFPIIQSYLDVILDGCLQVGGEAFARTFLETTIGWVDVGSTNTGDGSDKNSYFLNDRAKPGYVRASAAAAANAETIDRILGDYVLVDLGEIGCREGSNRPHRQMVSSAGGGGATSAEQEQTVGSLQLLLSYRRDIK